MLHRDCCCGVEPKVGQHSIPSFGPFAPCWPCRVESGFGFQGFEACLIFLSMLSGTYRCEAATSSFGVHHCCAWG